MARPVMAQVSFSAADARSQGMGNTCAALSDLWTGNHNPAGLAVIDKPAAGIFSEDVFLTHELFAGAMAFVLPVGNGCFSLSYATQGTAALSQGQTCLSFGRKIGKYTRAGIGFHYLNLNQPAGYTDLYAIVPAIGLQILPVKKISFGLQVFNPAGQSYIPERTEAIPVIFSAGLGYQPEDNFLISFDIAYQLHSRPVISGGLEADLSRKIQLRFGAFTGDHPSYTAGAGFIAGKLSIDMAFVHHYSLGFSPVIGLSHSFK